MSSKITYRSGEKMSDILKRALNLYGEAADMNYYGVPAAPDDVAKHLGDWNADGLLNRHRDFRSRLTENKGDVLKTLGAATASTLVFNPEIIQPRLIDTVKRKFPAVTSIAKTPAVGKTVHVPVRTTGVQTIHGAGDGAALTGLDQTFVEVTGDQIYLYTPGSVSWAAQKLTEKTINLLAESMSAHMLDHQFYKEKLLFRSDLSGTSAVSSAIDVSAEATGFEGLFEQLEDDSKLIDLANARGINIGDIEEQYFQIEDAGGEPGITFLDRASYSRVRKEAAAQGKIDFDTPKYGFGLREFNIEGIPCVWTPGLLSATGSRAAVSLDFRAWGEYPLLPVEMVEVAQQMADKKEFFLRNYTTLIIHTTKWAYAHVDGK